MKTDKKTLKEKRVEVKKKQTTLTRIENEIRFNSKLCRSQQVIQWICVASLPLTFYNRNIVWSFQKIEKDGGNKFKYAVCVSYIEKKSNRA